MTKFRSKLLSSSASKRKPLGELHLNESSSSNTYKEHKYQNDETTPKVLEVEKFVKPIIEAFKYYIENRPWKNPTPPEYINQMNLWIRNHIDNIMNSANLSRPTMSTVCNPDLTRDYLNMGPLSPLTKATYFQHLAAFLKMGNYYQTAGEESHHALLYAEISPDEIINHIYTASFSYASFSTAICEPNQKRASSDDYLKICDAFAEMDLNTVDFERARNIIALFITTSCPISASAILKVTISDFQKAQVTEKGYGVWVHSCINSDLDFDFPPELGFTDEDYEKIMEFIEKKHKPQLNVDRDIWCRTPLICSPSGQPLDNFDQLISEMSKEIVGTSLDILSFRLSIYSSWPLRQ